jgi:hypothetical protein
MSKLFFIFFIFSCASQKTEKLVPINAADVRRQLDQVCMTTEGKGKIESEGKSFRFDYENVFDAKEEQWILSLNFVLAGEEYVKVEKKNGQVSGNLLQRLVGKISKKDFNQLKKTLLSLVGSMQLFDQYLLQKPDLLAESCEMSKDNLRCKRKLKNFEFSATSARVEFFAKAQAFNLSWLFYPKHQQIQLLGERDFQGQMFTIELHPTVCVAPKA